jgi:hypothetical protein
MVDEKAVETRREVQEMGAISQNIKAALLPQSSSNM